MGRVTELAFSRRADAVLRGGPRPPDNGDMEARVARLETLAEKADTRLALIERELVRVEHSIRGDLHREVHAQTWRMIGVLAAMFAGLLGVMAKGFGWL